MVKKGQIPGLIRTWMLLAILAMALSVQGKPVLGEPVQREPVQAEWVSATAGIMGTEVHVEIELPAQSTTGREEGGAFFGKTEEHPLVQQALAEMERINQLWNPWQETSELYRMNHVRPGQWMPLSAETCVLMKKAAYFYQLTNGAFDISFASVGHLFNYREGIRPTAEQQARARALIGPEHYRFEPDSCRFLRKEEGVRLDFGGIAKGYAVDRVISQLQQAGIRSALVSAGGDTRLLGRKNQEPWVIGIKHPREDAVVIRIPLENAAISTSGDYERYFERQGKRYHHIISPGSGESARDVVSVSIIANESMTADALSTSVFVLGVQDGLALIDSLPDISAIIIDNKGNIFYSSDLVEGL